jgi:hypothetical protein
MPVVGALTLGVEMSVSTTSAQNVTFASVADYVAADTKGKAAIRKAADKVLRDAIRSGDMATATAAQSALDTYRTPTTKAPAEVNWQQLVADRIATLNAAIVALAEGNFEGAPEGFKSDATTTGTVDESALPTLTKVRKSARRDLGSLIEQVVVGPFQTVAQIRARIVAATDGEYVPSDGAIAMRLFPSKGQCTLVGVVPVEATATAPRGAISKG